MVVGAEALEGIGVVLEGIGVVVDVGVVVEKEDTGEVVRKSNARLVRSFVSRSNRNLCFLQLFFICVLTP